MAAFPLSVRLIAVGKLRDAHWSALSEDYLSRLCRYLEMEVVEVRDHVGRGRPEAEAVREEGRALLKALRPDSQVVALVIEGTALNSTAFAEFLQRQQDQAHRQLDFILGGPVGLSAEVLARAHQRLSLSALTFSHELARIVLLEQLYRACTILRGEKYHK